MQYLMNSFIIFNRTYKAEINISDVDPAKLKGEKLMASIFDRTINGKSYKILKAFYKGTSKQFSTPVVKGLREADYKRKFKPMVKSWKSEIDDRLNGISDTSMTVTELFTEWRHSDRITGKEYWTQNEHETFGNIFVAKYGDMRVRDIRNSHIRELVMEEYNTDPSKVNRTQKVLKNINTMLNWGIKNERGLTSNPISIGLKAEINTMYSNYMADREIIEELSYADASQILKAVEGKPYEITFHMMFLHGMRISEALAVEWKDIKLDTNYPTVSVTGQRGYYGDKKKTKTSNGIRFIPLHRATQDVVQRMMTQLEGMPTGFMFATHNGTMYNDTNFRNRIWNTIIQGIGLPSKYTPHISRAFFITASCDNGVPEITLREWVGHTDTDLIRKVYARKMKESEHMNDIKLVA